MDKLKKFLLKLTLNERGIVEFIKNKIETGNLVGLDVKKLQGVKDLFRVRKGDIRFKFHRAKDGKFFIDEVDRRGDHTY